jgi:dipeptidyl aminopeptidase/acylaminoacyl peptidase
MRRLLILTAAAFLSLPLFAQPAKNADDAFLDRFNAVKQFEETAISPDGKRVAWIVADDGAYVDGARVTAGKHEESGLAFSPDSKHLAFISDKQLLVDGKPMTNVNGWLAEPKWSPDGKSIAFLFIENAGRAAGPLVAMSRDVGVIEEQIAEQRIAILDLDTKKLRVVTPADMYVYHYDWSPDGNRMAAEAAPGNGDQNYWIAQLYVVDTSKATMKAIYKPKLQIADPKWVVSGNAIAFIEGLMSDEGSTGGDVMIVSADGTNPENLTPNMSASATSILGGRDLLDIEYLAIENGKPQIRRVSTSYAETGHHTNEVLWSGTDRLGSVSVTSDLAISAAVRDSATHPPEVWVGPVGGWKQRTHANDDYHVAWGESKSIEWTNDGMQMQGWLLYPADYSPAKHYPLVVQIHGGPASAARNGWPSDVAGLLARHGFFVFMPNPRGSYGGGETFTQANVKDFGHGDLRDIITGVDAVTKELPSIDGQRVGIWGWSYGGYMTMFAITQTQRFRAAVSGAGLANWLSYYGENDITQWMVPYFGASVYDDPAVYAKSSAMTFIKNVKTPTLLLVGERDGECPAPQSFEFWRALKTLNVPTQLVVYPDEGHRISKPEHKRDRARRVVGWFEGRL